MEEEIKRIVDQTDDDFVAFVKRRDSVFYFALSVFSVTLN